MKLNHVEKVLQTLFCSHAPENVAQKKNKEKLVKQNDDTKSVTSVVN